MALSVTIDYLAAVRPEAALVAEAREVKQGRRAGFYEVSVATEDGEPVAAAHCIAHRIMSSAEGPGRRANRRRGD